jgi:hypothetical protein
MKIKKITKLGKEDVYNLYVPETHNFAIQDGLVVSNCDTVRYGFMSRFMPRKKGGGRIIL